MSSHGFNTPTYNFIMGDAIDMAPPSNEELAHILFETIDELWHNGDLEILAKDDLDDIGNWILRDALVALKPERYAELARHHAQAREIFDTTGSLAPQGQSTAYLFVGWGPRPGGQGALWFWIERENDSREKENNGVLDCREIDVNDLIKIFDRNSWPLGDLIFQQLVGIMKEDVQLRRLELEKLERAHGHLNRRLRAIRTARERPTPLVL